MSNAYPKCPSCGGHDWTVTRDENVISVASTRDLNGPFKNEEQVDGELASLTFQCERAECQSEAEGDILAVLEDLYYV